MVKALNQVYTSTPALYEMDFDEAGFDWIEAGDAEQNVVVFARYGKDPTKDVLVCAMNLSPTPRPGYRTGFPAAGRWTKVLDTDATSFGGSGFAEAQEAVETEPTEWHGQAQSAELNLPPLGVVWFVPES